MKCDAGQEDLPGNAIVQDHYHLCKFSPKEIHSLERERLSHRRGDEHAKHPLTGSSAAAVSDDAPSASGQPYRPPPSSYFLGTYILLILIRTNARRRKNLYYDNQSDKNAISPDKAHPKLP